MVTIKKRYKSILWQILFWSVFTVLNFLSIQNEDPIIEAVFDSIIETILIAIFVYFNVFLLIQKYLFKRRYFSYIIIFITILSIMGIVKNTLVALTFDYPFDIGMLLFDYPYFFFIVAGFSSVWIIIEQLKVKNQLIEAEKDQVEAHYKILKAQINPHFLFNMLNNINFLIQKDKEKASEVLFMLSEILRYQLYDTDVEKVGIDQEIKHLRNYIELEKVRMGKRLNLITKFNIVDNSIKIAPFLFLPLIENAFKHSSSTGISDISINMVVNKREIRLTVENSFPNCGQIKSNITGGLGLKNLDKRLQLLFPDKYRLELQKKINKYYTYLELNLD